MEDTAQVLGVMKFDTGGKLDKIKEVLKEMESRGLKDFYLSQKEYQMVKELENDWFDLERKCDVHNVGEAFSLLAEAETERERKQYASYMKGVMKDLYGNNGTKPLKWEKAWDV